MKHRKKGKVKRMGEWLKALPPYPAGTVGAQEGN